MTRKEEATNKILEFIDIVKDVPKNESILAIGMDMVEWADKTMLDRFSHWLFKNITHRVSNGIGNGLIINFDSYSDMVEDLRKAMEE